MPGQEFITMMQVSAVIGAEQKADQNADRNADRNAEQKTITAQQPEASEAAAKAASRLADEYLEHHAFRNPVTFLEVLEKNFDKIPEGHYGLLTRDDLANYARKGDDAELRPVAAAAAIHFEDMQKLSQLPELSGKKEETGHWRPLGTVQGISKGDLDIDLDLVRGNTSRHLIIPEIVGAVKTLGAGLGALCLATAVIADWHEASRPILEGLGAFALGDLTLIHGFEMKDLKTNMQNLAAHDRKALTAWPEMNRPE